jgi:hypothetical protein
VQLRPFALVVVVAASISACGSGRPAEDASRAALRTPVAALADPTLRPARLIPLYAGEDDKSFGTEPGGGKRMLVSGVRVVRLAGGGVQSAVDPMPAPPSTTVEVPERLGGGFLFAIGPVIWRADKWLAPLRMIYAAPQNPSHLFIGLDRAYVRLPNNAYMAFDAKVGTPMDLGPWPGSPDVSRYVAADGWRAVAIADLRGAVATFDAGAKWQPLALAIQPKELHLSGDAIVVSGVDASGTQQAYAVQPNGQIAHLQQDERPRKPPTKTEATDDAQQRAARNPLSAAVLDGWPLEGGTVLMARDGALTRMRLSDGNVLDTAPDAFPLKPSRCHPVPLSPDKAPAAFGFVCGVPHGATEIYAYDPRGGKLATLRHFDTPRAVFSPANGTLVVEGSCDADAIAVDLKKNEQTYCIMRRTGAFEDFIVNGDVGTERVVPLADGRTAIVSPPVGDIGTARLTIFDGSRPRTIPIKIEGTSQPKPRVKTTRRNDDDEEDEERSEPDDETIVTAVLRSGTWLRGVQERTPNVLSAWVEHSGRYVGVEIAAVSGKAKHGPYVADLGTAIVSGRYGLGWTPSRQGYETTDGGMTWKPLALPEPLESMGPAAGSASHGCGPLGCVLAGWIRLGWGGATEDAQASSYPPDQVQHTFDIRTPSALRLRCELATAKPSLPSLDTSNGQYYGGYRYYRYGGYYGGRQPQNEDWYAFYTIKEPTLGTDDLGYSRRTDEAFDHGNDRSGNATQVSVGAALARFYAWGPKGIDWDLRGRFLVRFTSPFESSGQLHVTQTTGIPRFIADSTQFLALGGAPPHQIQSYSLVAGDDLTHALIAIRRGSNGYGYGYGYGYGQQVQPGNDMVLVELESERPPIEVHRADNVALGDLESAVRASGRWYIATSEPMSTVVWEVDSGLAREIARIPRTSEGSTRPPAVHLAKRADGRMIAALVDGAPVTQGAGRPNTWVAETWALPIDVASGTLHEPERLGASNGGNKTITVCGPQDGGWVVDGKWPGPSNTITLTSASGSSLQPNGTLFVRYRVAPATLCVEKVSATSYGEPTNLGSLGKVDGPFVDAGLVMERARQGFRCVGN